METRILIDAIVRSRGGARVAGPTRLASSLTNELSSCQLSWSGSALLAT